MMTETSYLDALFERLGGGMKFGLERTEAFMDYLGHPHRRFRSVHVAGTNGKGSVTAIVAEILQAHGESTGRFTSPHLVDYNERLRMNGKMIGEETVRRYLEEWETYMETHELSFFEITTGLGFRWFAESGADSAVVETGLGGRLDSTNVLDPELSVITRIAKDHTGILGKTLKKIAGEKAGIIKRGRPVITCPQGRGVMEVLRRRAGEMEAPFHVSPSLRHVKDIKYRDHAMHFRLGRDTDWYRSRLVGGHQLENILLALSAAALYLGSRYDRNLAVRALASVHWPARFERVNREPLVIYDAGHNLNGAEKILETLDHMYPGRKIRCVLGLLKDKDMGRIHRLFRDRDAVLQLCPVDSHRSPSHEELAALADHRGEAAADADEAITRQFQALKSGTELLLIFGSHHVAEAVYRHFPGQEIG